MLYIIAYTDYLFGYNFTTETALLNALSGYASLNVNPNDDNMLVIVNTQTYYYFQIYYIDNNTMVYGTVQSQRIDISQLHVL